MRTRKQWLEIFIRLADTGAAAIEYRKRLRIKPAALKVHIKKLTQYRKELQDILKEEENVARLAKEQTKQRERRARLQQQIEHRPDTESDTEALGARDDSRDKSDVYRETNIRKTWSPFKPTVSQDEDGDDVSS